MVELKTIVIGVGFLGFMAMGCLVGLFMFWDPDRRIGIWKWYLQRTGSDRFPPPASGFMRWCYRLSGLILFTSSLYILLWFVPRLLHELLR